MKIAKQVHTYVCDGCGRETTVPDGEQPPGYHGTARSVVDDDDGNPVVAVEWYAHRDMCIKQAVLGAIANPSPVKPPARRR